MKKLYTLHPSTWTEFMYIVSWELEFDVFGHFNMLLVWIDLPFRAIALETSCKSLVESLGKFYCTIRERSTMSPPTTVLVYSRT